MAFAKTVPALTPQPAILYLICTTLQALQPKAIMLSASRHSGSKALLLTHNAASTAVMSHLCTKRICHVCDVHSVPVVQTAEGCKYN